MITVSFPLTLNYETLCKMFEEVQLMLLCESAIGLDTASQCAARHRIFASVGEKVSAHAQYAVLLAGHEQVQTTVEWWVRYEIARHLLDEFGVSYPNIAKI